jgi:hypothetical protein
LESAVSSAPPTPDAGAVAFAEKVLTLLAEGRFTATYKYAVMLGLIDLCLERSARSGAAPQSITTRQLAEKVLELYWPHTAPFGESGETVLKQNRQGQAEILSLIMRFRARHAPDPSATLTRARHHAPEALSRLVRDVEWKLVEMPLPRLQLVGNERDVFLFQIAWNESIRRREFETGDFDNLIRFVGSAGDLLVRLAGLLRPLIQREWASLVARFNPRDVSQYTLEAFLFGVDRVATARVRAGLLELANGRCFYCDSRAASMCELDHFIPWSRYPDNGVDNLVVADRRCNGAKSDYLASPDHVARWLERSQRQAAQLSEIAARAEWDRHPERSTGVARSIYLRLPEDARLWQVDREFVLADRGRLVAMFRGAADSQTR